MSEVWNYWWDVTAISFTWAVTLWPVHPTLFGILVTGVTMFVFWKLGQLSEVKNIGIAFFVSLVVSAALFVGIVILIGPILHWEVIKQKLAELDQLQSEKKTFLSALDQSNLERDEAIKQQKLMGEANTYLEEELDKTTRQLANEKAAKSKYTKAKTRSEMLGSLIEAGEWHLRKCRHTPESQRQYGAMNQWLDEVGSFLGTSFAPHLEKDFRAHVADLNAPASVKALCGGRIQKGMDYLSVFSRNLSVPAS